MVRAGGPFRFVGLAFLAAVVVVIVALITGYGIPVGIGALAGFVLGALAGLVGTLWLSRGAGRSMNVGGMSWSSSDSSGGMGPTQLDQMRERSELLQIDLGPIRSVLPVLATADAGGYVVQLVAAELREAGTALILDVRSKPGSPQPGFWADVSVRDEMGTTYRAAGQTNGSGLNPMRCAISIVPAAPSNARRLDVNVERFVDPFRGVDRAAEGPWTFLIDLPGDVAPASPR
jgi:hypothetical protein